MLRTHPILFRGLAVTAVLMAGTEVSGEEVSRDQQIADLQKQIKELSRKVEELRTTAVKAPTSAFPEGTIPADWTKALTWRCIGPANMGGRITGISVFEA